MGIVVQKYGGSSVADIDKLRVVAEQVVRCHRAGDLPVVVVSAMGKTTDELIRLAREASLQPHRRELDMLVTAGERISMALLSMIIHDAGVEAISFTGSQSGIITESNHQGARIIEVRPWRIEEALERRRVVIVAGYQGVSLDREVTTLGRGGSDTTAVALAAALKADACEIYSDVDGVYSADPRVCPQARLIGELSYETMQAMAGAGAKVLNAQAVDFARRAGIVIKARKTGDGSGRQTVIHDVDVRDLRAPSVAAVIGTRDVTRLVGGTSEERPALLFRIAEAGGRSIAVDGSAILVHRVDLPEGDDAPFVELARERELTAESVAAVSLVGSGLLTDRAFLSGLAECQPDSLIGGWSGTGTCLTAAVSPDACDEVVGELHRRFCEDCP